MKSTKKAFTLVELIVVITILAILGTIAFISLGSYTGDARNAKRSDALSKIATSMENAIIGGKSVMSFAVTGSEVSGASIAGATPTGTNYVAGDANYTALGVKASDFQDPSSGDNYKVGSTTLVGGKYEVAGKLEDGAGARARVIGNWSPRVAADTASVGAIGSTARKFVVTNTADINKLRVGDTLNEGGQVNSISNDGLTITTSADITTGTTSLQIAADESDGLVGSVADPAVAVTDDSLNVPY